jgi:hypothetical protein
MKVSTSIFVALLFALPAFGQSLADTTRVGVFDPSKSWITTLDDVKEYLTEVNSPAPTFTIGSGWGSGATASIEGTDMAGMITINSGTGSLSFTSLGTLTFNTAFESGAKYAVFYSSENANATGANMGGYLRTTSRAIGSFVIDASNSNITSRAVPSTTYTVFYHVVRYD